MNEFHVMSLPFKLVYFGRIFGIWKSIEILTLISMSINR